MAFNRIIREFCLLGFFLLCRGGILAQGYFPGRQDVILEYVRKDAADGRFRWRHVVRINSLTDNGAYIRYTSESVFTGRNGKPLYRSAINETAVVEKASGNVSMDVADVMVSYIRARTGLQATGSGVLSTLPANMGPLKYSLLISERKVLRNETIVVPAGRFDCVVISEQKTESGPGHNRSVTNVTWYSKGVGYVRHDTYVEGKLETSETLQSVH